MTALAVVYLVALIVIMSVLVFSPAHSFKGWPSTISFLTLFLSGAVLAVNAL